MRGFGGLIRHEEAELRYRYKSHAIVSDLAKWCLLVLPRDAPKLGIDDPNDLSVTLAVGMSIPILFEPVSSLTRRRAGNTSSLTAGCSRTSRSGSSTPRSRSGPVSGCSWWRRIRELPRIGARPSRKGSAAGSC